MNEYNVMLVKVQGTFVWHKHDATDDFFLVLKGALEIQMRDRTVTLGPGELFVRPLKASSIVLAQPKRRTSCSSSRSAR